MKHIYKIHELASIVGLSESFIHEFVDKEWISPYEPREEIFDDEDLARACLIRDLRDRFEVNDEAVGIILHLVDELNSLHKEIRRRIND